MQSSRPDLLTVLQIFSNTNLTVFHNFDFQFSMFCYSKIHRMFCWLDLFSSQLNSEAHALSRSLTNVYKDQHVIVQFTATHLFKGTIATSSLYFTLVLLLWYYTSAYSFLCKHCLSFSWYIFHYKISLTWQVCVSWLYPLNINVNACTLSAVTSCLHNRYDKLKGIECCSFAEAQTPLHRPCWDQGLWVLPVGKA